MSDAYVGEIRLFAGNYAPENWMLCMGQALPIAGNEMLYSLIGTTYGGSGNTFNLPDLRGRVPIHAGTGTGLTARTLGQSGGQEEVTLTTAMLPAHSHTLSALSGRASTATPGGNMLAATQSPLSLYWPPGEAGTNGNLDIGAVSANSQLQNRPHPNMQPSIALTFMICVRGLYPSPAK